MAGIDGEFQSHGIEYAIGIPTPKEERPAMLTPRQRQFLKAQAHPLKAHVHVGKSGLTPALGAELDVMLDSLELVKIRLNSNSSEELEGVAAQLAAAVPGLEVVRTLGKTVLVYRASRTHPTQYPLP
jgi:RNA-binding protein